MGKWPKRVEKTVLFLLHNGICWGDVACERKKVDGIYFYFSTNYKQYEKYFEKKLCWFRKK